MTADGLGALLAGVGESPSQLEVLMCVHVLCSRGCACGDMLTRSLEAGAYLVMHFSSCCPAKSLF